MSDEPDDNGNLKNNNVENANKIAILFGLASNNSLGELEQILKADPTKASLKNEQGIRLLMWAMYHHQTEAAALIYQYLIKPEPSEVVALNDLFKLKQLLERNPEWINEFSDDGFTLLHYACFFGHVECSSFLIEYGAKVNSVAQNPSKVYPLHSAVATQVIRIVKLLLDFGANVNAKQNGGYTALMSAAMHNNKELIDLLLSHRADIGITDDTGKSAYDHGLEKGFDLLQLKPPT